MKITRRALALVMALLLLLTAGCAKKPETPPETQPTVPPTTAPKETQAPTQPTMSEAELAAASLDALRQEMAATTARFAVAYFGVCEPGDPFALMQAQAPALCAERPFLLSIPQAQIVGPGFGALYCIVPLDPNATLTVMAGGWQEYDYVYSQEIYRGTGEPILLFCNSEDWHPDTEIRISDAAGETAWAPDVDEYGCVISPVEDPRTPLFLDLTPYREMLTKVYRDSVSAETVLPTAQTLIGSTWRGWNYTPDDRYCTVRITFREDTCSVYWTHDYDSPENEYLDAKWTLTEEDGIAVLTIDFREFAGVLRYDLLYDSVYHNLYVAMDVFQDSLPLGQEPLSRFLDKLEGPPPADMVGTWELAMTEVEGYQEEVAPGAATMEITQDENGQYWVSYTHNEFPEKSFQHKKLTVVDEEWFTSFGNDLWHGLLDHTHQGMEYRIAPVMDGSLVLQNYWEMDGAPMVSYSWFHRVEG